jgi:hypothetical protein
MDAKFLRAGELGIRLEMVRDLPIWEPSPVYKRQKAVDQIRATSRRASSETGRNGCNCIRVAGVYVSFPDG